jgi:hypothetical protein
MRNPPVARLGIQPWRGLQPVVCLSSGAAVLRPASRSRHVSAASSATLTIASRYLQRPGSKTRCWIMRPMCYRAHTRRTGQFEASRWAVNVTFATGASATLRVRYVGALWSDTISA